MCHEAALCGRCNYALTGLDEQRCPECQQSFDLEDVDTFNATGRPIDPVTRFLIAAPVWPIVLPAVPWLLWHLWALHPPQCAMMATWYHGWTNACAAVVIARLAQLGVRYLAAEQFGHRAYLRRLRSQTPAWLLLGVILSAATIAARERWPMRLAFAISQTELEELADRALTLGAGAKGLAPATAGVFEVSTVFVPEDGAVILYTYEGVKPPGQWGFARMPNRPDHIRDMNPRRNERPFDLLDARRITGDWYVLYNAYWAVKDGWS